MPAGPTPHDSVNSASVIRRRWINAPGESARGPGGEHRPVSSRALQHHGRATGRKGPAGSACHRRSERAREASGESQTPLAAPPRPAHEPAAVGASAQDGSNRARRGQPVGEGGRGRDARLALQTLLQPLSRLAHVTGDGMAAMPAALLIVEPRDGVRGREHRHRRTGLLGWCEARQSEQDDQERNEQGGTGHLRVGAGRMSRRRHPTQGITRGTVRCRVTPSADPTCTATPLVCARMNHPDSGRCRQGYHDRRSGGLRHPRGHPRAAVRSPEPSSR